MKENRRAIGSYFALEIPKGSNYYHNSGIRLNTGRNAFEYILRVKNVKTIFLPYYSCDALFTPLTRLNIKFQFYHLNSDLYPDIDIKSIGESDFFLYINYFGLCNKNVASLANCIKNLIIDNSQAFFCDAFNNIPTFYSARKFFGVADGAFLLNITRELELERDKSEERMGYLLSRIENEPEIAYNEYQKIEFELNNLPLKLISPITELLLSSIPYEKIRAMRNENFLEVHKAFINQNRFRIENPDSPLIYPLWIRDGKNIRKRLIEKRIFVTSYWPNVLSNPEINDIEKSLVNDLVPVHIDQRYNIDDIKYVIKTVQSLIRRSNS